MFRRFATEALRSASIPPQRLPDVRAATHEAGERNVVRHCAGIGRRSASIALANKPIGGSAVAPDRWQCYLDRS
jgi:hypothetical protein